MIYLIIVLHIIVAICITLVLQNSQSSLLAFILGMAAGLVVFFLNITYLITLLFIKYNNNLFVSTNWKFYLSVLFFIGHLVLIYLVKTTKVE